MYKRILFVFSFFLYIIAAIARAYYEAAAGVLYDLLQFYHFIILYCCFKCL